MFMQIPDAYKSFQKKTYLLYLSGMRAQIHMADGNSVQEIDVLEADGYPLGDDEVIQKVDAGTGIQKPVVDEEIKQRVRRSFFNDLANRLHIDLQNNAYEQLIIILPIEYRNAFVEGLHTDVASTISGEVMKNLINLPADERIPTIQKELGWI